MAITIVLSCRQSDFHARHHGSCEGISFYYCMRALDLGMVQALADLKQQRSIGTKVEVIMARQDQICGDLFASGSYETDRSGTPVSDPRDGNTPGIRNQGKAIQEFHNLYSREAQTLGFRSIGTLSSFFEGGFARLLERTISLMRRCGKGAALIAMQSSASHSVAIAWDGTDLYFFDPNKGVHELTDHRLAPTELARHLVGSYTDPFCVHANIFALNR